MSRQDSESGYRLDEIDRRIIYELMSDARASSAPKIAEAVNVSPGTIRNRIERLEEHGILTGYHAHVDFERTSGRLTALFMCSVPFAERESVAHAAYAIPGVVNIRLLMGGRRNFHVLAVGEDTTDLRRIGTALSEIGVEIEDEMLVEHEAVQPYSPFGPDEDERRKPPTDFVSLSGDSEVVELTVRTDAPIADVTISEAVERGVISDDPLIIAIEREGDVLTPHGDTHVRPDDVVTVFSRGGADDRTVNAFIGSSE
ncbi:AsnC family transcriptional regulator [Halalkalicoccus sp. GCM10025322]|uniref:Lrp/AsnC family transcriptional regulator n=1 Tax=Halalkalicoccus TaxID=332246 RepID=UPI002F96BBD2